MIIYTGRLMSIPSVTFNAIHSQCDHNQGVGSKSAA
jgi:hypothetical protein